MESKIETLVLEGELIPVGARSIVRMGKIERYLVYLPENMNTIWRYLHSKRVKVEVYVRVPRELQGE